ncbi:hypothetical protein MRET_3055 [Malassezia restricta]|uniref:Uncharacterized protein n=1 Tax=Malassezia restricta (strain ATCC 96810 / NBRC 103918 / CBS 7877) TaxID=425264 RepID=A0A3G2S7P9_MALR7|nr:uncharacterized protein MRET_3055 [Malassezia restricta]AXA51172.1 hypothetical protein MRET_3055 [Malassezia restricta]AYO43352.1 hypothetical protein DNF11_2402 [Malassezia restricta CBS 7877]
MGAGPRYPYPKEVWSPSGGWWSRPKNWATNTLVVASGLAVISYGIFKFGAEREWRHQPPIHPIPSQLWARQFREGELKVKSEE